jgi:hypothetical protein
MLKKLPVSSGLFLNLNNDVMSKWSAFSVLSRR